MKYTSELKTLCPTNRSMRSIIPVMFNAANTPSTPPMTVPITPMTVPWTMKIAMICRGVAPRVRRIAMSVRLSATTMIRVAMMLKAATAMISSRSRPIMVFSIFIALNRLPWVLVQSLDLKPCPNS